MWGRLALTRSAEDGGGLALMEIEHAHQHAEAAEPNDDFRCLASSVMPVFHCAKVSAPLLLYGPIPFARRHGSG
jgi:hypothetical protein